MTETLPPGSSEVIAQSLSHLPKKEGCRLDENRTGFNSILRSGEGVLSLGLEECQCSSQVAFPSGAYFVICL